MKKRELFLLAIILFGSFIIRLYKIDNPVADWHSWRQADTAAVARNFIKDGFNFLKPQVDNYVITNEWGLANPQRLFYVEPPFFQTLVFVLYKIWGVRESLARLISILFSLGAILLIFSLSKKYFDELTAILSAFFFAFMPYNIYYGRVIMPEPMMIFTSLGAVYFISEWLDKEKVRFFILAISFTALALLLKAYTLVLFIPITYLFWRKYGYFFYRRKQILIFLIASILPFILWRYFILLHPEGIPASTWLFNAGELRFTGAFFHWIFAERLGKLILAYGGIPLFIIGLILKSGKKEGWLFHWWLMAIFAYFSILATGNVTHDYYQVPFIPVAVIFLAKGTAFLIRGANNISRIFSWPVVIVLILAMLAFGWYEVRGYYWVNHPEIVEAGRAVDRLSPKEAKVIAPYGRDVAFLYQTNRHGWAVVDRPISDLIKEGATHYVSVKFDAETNDLIKQYKVLKQTPHFVILDLTKTSNQ